ncbi:MAG: hypothetical protein ACK4HF_06390 [Paracoccaceae bacterium]
MFNPLPFLALGAVIIGYTGTIDRVDRSFDQASNPSVAAFPAVANLSVHEFVSKLPETVQDPLCDAKDRLTASLSHDFAETLEDTWEQAQAVTMELWASDLMGTWTLLRVSTVTGNAGLACIVSSGFGWTEGMGVQDILPARSVS